MTRQWDKIAIVISAYSGGRHDDLQDLRRDLERVLVSSSIEIVKADYLSLPIADIVVADESHLTGVMEADERTYHFLDGDRHVTIPSKGRLVLDRDRCRRIVLYDASYGESMRLLDTYQFAASIVTNFKQGHIDGLREVGQRIGAREVKSFSRLGAWQSASYTTIEHDDYPTFGLLLGRYLQEYAPDLPRLPPARTAWK